MEVLLPSRLVLGSLQLLVTVPLLLLTLAEESCEFPFNLRSDLLLLLPPWGELQLRVTRTSLLRRYASCYRTYDPHLVQDI